MSPDSDFQAEGDSSPNDANPVASASATRKKKKGHSRNPERSDIPRVRVIAPSPDQLASVAPSFWSPKCLKPANWELDLK
jgi:hypothetical protein